MNENDDRVDVLLHRNVERQLVDFDWEGLRRGIESRLPASGAPTCLWIWRGKWVATAAVVALTVCVLVLLAVRATRPGPRDLSAGDAKVVMIEAVHAAGTARVSFIPSQRPARCEVTVLSSDTPRPKGDMRASWCIAATQRPSVLNDDDGRDASDVLCLF